MFLRPRKFLFLLFLFGSGITAQSQSILGSINGSIHDASGAGIAGAKIMLHREETNTERSISSAPDGSYTALNLDPGTYTVSVAHEGFATKTSTHLS